MLLIRKPWHVAASDVHGSQQLLGLACATVAVAAAGQRFLHPSVRRELSEWTERPRPTHSTTDAAVRLPGAWQATPSLQTACGASSRQRKLRRQQQGWRRGALSSRGPRSRLEGRREPTPRESSSVVNLIADLYAAATTTAPPCSTTSACAALPGKNDIARRAPLVSCQASTGRTVDAIGST